MAQVSFTDLRQHLARYLDEAVESKTPLLVTRRGLLRSIADADTGRLEEHDLVSTEPE